MSLKLCINKFFEFSLVFNKISCIFNFFIVKIIRKLPQTIMDFTKFSDDNFDLKTWINGASAAQKETNQNAEVTIKKLKAFNLNKV